MNRSIWRVLRDTVQADADGLETARANAAEAERVGSHDLAALNRGAARRLEQRQRRDAQRMRDYEEDHG